MRLARSRKYLMGLIRLPSAILSIQIICERWISTYCFRSYMEIPILVQPRDPHPFPPIFSETPTLFFSVCFAIFLGPCSQVPDRELTYLAGQVCR